MLSCRHNSPANYALLICCFDAHRTYHFSTAPNRTCPHKLSSTSTLLTGCCLLCFLLCCSTRYELSYGGDDIGQPVSSSSRH
jgi:hypothetical protein